MTLSQLLLFCGLAGLVSCTIFLILTVVSTIRYRQQPGREVVDDAGLPPVALLKPLYGLEPNLEENIESFFRQDYPRFEIIFGTRDAKDLALDVVRAIQVRHPQVEVKVVFSGEPDRPNAKVCSLEKMCAAASNNYIVVSDSDVRVTPNYLRAVIHPLLDPKVGLVTCLYRGVPTGGNWSRLEALGMSVEMTSGVIVAAALEGMKFALGPTMATRRDVLHAMGGVGGLADYCADDYVLGRKVHESGYAVVLSEHVIEHMVINQSFKASIAHQVRWAKSTRFSRPKGHIGTGLTFAIPFGLLGMAAGLSSGHSLLAGALLAWAVLYGLAISIMVGWGVVRDPRSIRYCWLYPVRDLMGFCFWCASFAGRSIVWRGESYRLQFGGRMVRTGVAQAEEPASATVAVDNLA